jgi:hypothetical protein
MQSASYFSPVLTKFEVSHQFHRSLKHQISQTSIQMELRQCMQINKQSIEKTGMTEVKGDFCYYANALAE